MHIANSLSLTSFFFLSFKKKNICLLMGFIGFGFSVLAQNDSSKWVKYYYSTGQLSSEGRLFNGKPEGYWKSYYENGQLKSEGNRLNHKLEGLWKFYEELGDLVLTINYSEDIKKGQRQAFVKGKLLREDFFEEDKRNGVSKLYNEKGWLQFEIPYVDDLESGEGYELDSNSTIIGLLTYKAGVLVRKQSINLRDRLGRRQGVWIEFFDDRKVKVTGVYKNDLKEGYWKFFTASSALIRTEFWVNGILQSEGDATAKVEVVREIHPETGKLKLKGALLNGKLNGVQRLYNLQGEIVSSSVYDRGRLIEEGGIVDEEGRKQGFWKSFYEDGGLKHEGAYVDGLKTGIWKYYFRNGKLEQTGNFRADLAEGSWIWYYPNGKTWREEEYSRGLEDGSSMEYDSLGTVLAKGQYIEGLKEGQWYYLSGDHEEIGEYFEGERRGMWRHYYLKPEKVLRFEGNFVNGEEDGRHEYLYLNGQVKVRERYSSGIKQGIWEYFKEDGSRYLTIEHNGAGEEVKYNGVKLNYGRRFKP